MLSMRAISRAAPRAAARLTSSSSAVLRSSAFARPAIASSFTVARTSVSAFSSVAARWAPAKAEVDTDLSKKLASEIQFETEIRENEPEPTTVQDFVQSGLFEIEDIAGREEVVLRRTYNDEKISITLSIADLANYDPELYDEDAALADEESDGQGKSEEQLAEESGEAEDDPEVDAGTVPCRLSIVIEKPGQGALNVEATAQEGSLIVDNLYYYKDAALAHAASAESAHAAQQVYPGPAFGSLDEDLQVLLDRYLEERGIGPSLAVFVPEYLDLKEQREYLGFLNNLKGFVDA